MQAGRIGAASGKRNKGDWVTDFMKSHGEEHFSQTRGGKLPPVHTKDERSKVAAPAPAAAQKAISVYDIQRKWQRRGADVRLVVSHEPGQPSRLEIDFIGIPRASRSKGYGSKLMKELVRAADSGKMDIALTPESSDRSERSKRFFDRHGFKLSTGPEDGEHTWMMRKIPRRADSKGSEVASARARAAEPKATSLFMENAKRFKSGDKDAFTDYNRAGKIGLSATGSKVIYGFVPTEKELEKRPPQPQTVPPGHFASWNVEKAEYEFLPKKKAYGGVVFNDKGEILLRMVAGRLDGYVWTFPKGDPAEGQTPEETAKLRVEEKTGVRAEIISEIQGDFEGGMTYARFYIMRFVSEGPARDKETAQTAWVKLEEAQDYLSQTLNEKGKKRDGLVLEAVMKYVKDAFNEKIKRSFLCFAMGLNNLPPDLPEAQSPAGGGVDAPQPVSGQPTTDRQMDSMECADPADVQNALIYWGKKEHRAEYSPKAQREILARILGAAQKLGVDPESSRKE
jgi:8-oxo-dGTP pyrophosphatase MutT (NUDIX family)/ribosomal protein S18 acetylase RimI-like enzyme